jgi:hypothetical protein
LHAPLLRCKAHQERERNHLICESQNTSWFAYHPHHSVDRKAFLKWSEGTGPLMESWVADISLSQFCIHKSYRTSIDLPIFRIYLELVSPASAPTTRKSIINAWLPLRRLLLFYVHLSFPPLQVLLVSK